MAPTENGYKLRFSVLDLSPIAEGSNAADSFKNTLDLAQHAERWGFHRYWLAEHHGMPGIASAATSVLMGHVAAGTSSIRIGAGGIMLPNHSPLVIAEQFGTLESLFPGRIDLGLGRAPGSNQITAHALRRNLASDNFPQDVMELISYFSTNSQSPVQAVPGNSLEVPIWILGSSLYGAQLAATFGLPYAFASHFAPDQIMKALEIYRETFQPSQYLSKPHVMLGFNIFAADTDEEAHLLASSMQQSFINLRSGNPSKLPPPIANYLNCIGGAERAMLNQVLSCSAIGSEEKVLEEIKSFIAKTEADELMITSQIFNHTARLHSYEITSKIYDDL
jgi:luciferase family oxidoreductase group 1